MSTKKPGLGLIRKEIQMTSKDELQRLFPRRKRAITESTVDIINATLSDPLFNGYSLIDTLVDYESVLDERRTGFIDYINAIKFCSHLETDEAVINAYKKTFKHTDFVQDRWDAAVDSEGYNALISASQRYRRRPVVQSILTKANIALGMMFQGYMYSGIEILHDEAKNAAFSKDRINAADKMVGHLLNSMPQESQISLNVGPNDEAKSAQTALMSQLAVIGQQQKTMIDAGIDISKVQKLHINVNDKDGMGDEDEDRIEDGAGETAEPAKDESTEEKANE